MKTHFSKYLLASLLFISGSTMFAACSQEISHSESDKQGWFGGTKHTEDTTYKNPDGTISHTHEEVKVNH
jgi:hypothetical protein